MLVSIMQPYFFPYIGYFQLIAACDAFIVFDDVQYIQRGWVNRNRILVRGTARWITMPVSNADHRLPINRRSYLLKDRVSLRVRRRIEGEYRHAPYYTATMKIVDEILRYPDSNVAAFNTHLLRRIADHLGIATPFHLASAVQRRLGPTGQERVVDICKTVGASGYINPIGGTQLYDSELFARHGLTLQFLQSRPSDYPQFGAPYVGGLSIIDVMMFNDPAAITRMLSEYALVPGSFNETSPRVSAVSPPQA